MTSRADSVAPAALRELLEADALAGASWADVVGELARVAGGRVRLAAADAALLCEADGTGVRALYGAETFDPDRPHIVEEHDVAQVFAARVVTTITCLDGLRMRGLAVASGERRIGLLLADEAIGAADAYLRAAATAVAIVAVRRDAESSAVAETEAWFVDELRFGTSRDDAELHRVARRFGVDLAFPQAAVSMTYDGTDHRMFATAVSWLESPARRDGGQAWTVLPARDVDRISLIARRLNEFVGDGAVRVAAGPPADSPTGIRLSFGKADFTLRVMAQRRRTGAERFADLGPLALLVGLPASELQEFVSTRLGPLLDRPDLLVTLREWLRYGGSWRNVASAVHIHRNSVGHRLDRVRSLLGVDPAEPAAAFELQLALTALEVLDATGSVH